MGSGRRLQSDTHQTADRELLFGSFSNPDFSKESSNSGAATTSNSWNGGGPGNEEGLEGWDGRCLRQGCYDNNFKGFYFSNWPSCAVETRTTYSPEDVTGANVVWTGGVGYVAYATRDEFCQLAQSCSGDCTANSY